MSSLLPSPSESPLDSPDVAAVMKRLMGAVVALHAEIVSDQQHFEKYMATLTHDYGEAEFNVASIDGCRKTIRADAPPLVEYEVQWQPQQIHKSQLQAILKGRIDGRALVTQVASFGTGETPDLIWLSWRNSWLLEENLEECQAVDDFWRTLKIDFDDLW